MAELVVYIREAITLSSARYGPAENLNVVVIKTMITRFLKDHFLTPLASNPEFSSFFVSYITWHFTRLLDR